MENNKDLALFNIDCYEFKVNTGVKETGNYLSIRDLSENDGETFYCTILSIQPKELRGLAEQLLKAADILEGKQEK
jgi:hypothetical protein